MKYIRTKDRIIEYNPNEIVSNNGVHIFISDDWNKSDYTYYEKDIVAQADTIKKLIDELVVHNPSNDGEFFPKHFVYQNKWETMLKPISDYQKSKGIEIYGAIWVQLPNGAWRLEPVAKVNEKGELELL